MTEAAGVGIYERMRTRWPHSLQRTKIHQKVQTMNTTIRSARPSDAAQILDIYGWYVENTAISFEYEIPSPGEFTARIEKTLLRFPYLVIEENGKILGYTYAGPFKARAAYDWDCEMSIYIDRCEHGRGLGRRLYLALEEELKKMGIQNLYACISFPETEDAYLTRDSFHFHKHMGYSLAGTYHKCGFKFGRWYDMVWMEKIIGKHEEEPRRVAAWKA